MKKIILSDPVFKEFYILDNKSDLAYIEPSIKDKSIKCGFLPNHGTILYFENIHFLIIDPSEPVETFAIWHNQKVIGYLDIPRRTAMRANCANNYKFCFGFDSITRPDRYI